ncbi:hypothetical protein BAY60_03395 [Prauserella muralis]|uniref:Uncharacterized protein n=2 Tax=Prauserella muralis TaxID=588067 RepID=A0A2V4B8S9_9PSEU|nr:hypothetical protein BAY60_03395 [Prauserella muralis]
MWSPEHTTVEDTLGRLIARGYRFVHPRDADGEIITVVGVRAHGHVIDVVRLDAEDDVTAMRLPGDEPNILEPRTVLWSRSGTMRAVVDGLLELSDDAHTEHAPSRTAGCWIRGGAGRAKYLMATA